MKDRIILGELYKLLFPERFPWFGSYFTTERELIQDRELSDDSFLNIKFKVRLVRYRLSVHNEEVQYVLEHNFKRLVDTYYDWQTCYPWHELKPILLYFLVFSKAQNGQDALKIMASGNFPGLFDKYSK